MRKETFWSVFVLFIAMAGLYAQPPEKNLAPKALQILHTASPRPDRIILTWEEDDLATQTVTWRSDTSIVEAFAEIAEVTPHFEFYKNSIKAKASSRQVEAIDETVQYHKATFTDLKPNTYYAYRVGQKDFWSEWIQFKTPPANDQEPYSFIYLGDAQNDLFPLWSRVVREAYRKAPNARFMLHAGDMINHSQNNYEWSEWFQAASFIFKMVPQVVVAGNHEYVKDGQGQKTGISPLYDPQFNFPDNGLPQLGDTNYFLDYLDSKIIVLNSNEDIEEQAVWLEEILKNNTKKWVVVSFHHPVISAAEGRINEGVMKNWKPILDKYKVDLVLQGHDHSYGRGNQVNSGLGEWDEDSGTVYVVSVSGRKMYAMGNHPWMQRKAQDTQLFQVITIEGNTLVYKAYTTDNKVFDSFQLRKKKGRKNRFKSI